MKKLIIFLIKSIVDNPEKVTVEIEEIDASFTNITVTVDQADMGKVIGKSGKIIKAIRILLRVLSIKEGKRVNLLLSENLQKETPELT